MPKVTQLVGGRVRGNSDHPLGLFSPGQTAPSISNTRRFSPLSRFRCFLPEMTSRARPLEPLPTPEVEGERPFPPWQATEPHPPHQLSLSQVLRPDDDQVRAKNKAFSRLSRKEQGVQGHSRELASRFKSKVLSPAGRRAHLGPPHSTHSWPTGYFPPTDVPLCHTSGLCQCWSRPGMLFPALPTNLSRPPSLLSDCLPGNPGTPHSSPNTLTFASLCISVFPALGTTLGTQQAFYKCMFQAWVSNH